MVLKNLIEKIISQTIFKSLLYSKSSLNNRGGVKDPTFEGKAKDPPKKIEAKAKDLRGQTLSKPMTGNGRVQGQGHTFSTLRLKIFLVFSSAKCLKYYPLLKFLIIVRKYQRTESISNIAESIDIFKVKVFYLIVKHTVIKIERFRPKAVKPSSG